MNAIIKRVATAAVLVLSVLSTNAQNKIYDVITLKDDKGVIKGFVNQQILGDDPSMLITPIEALLTINVDDIEGGQPKTIYINDNTCDLIVIKGSGEEIVGNIVSESIGKWYKIKTTNLSQKSYPYSEVLKLSKELVDSDDSIFDVYGILESITLNNGIMVSGVIVDQKLGESITVKDVKDGMDKIIDINNVAKINKTAYHSNQDLFKQCAYIDIVRTASESIKGVIVSQVLGENVMVRLLNREGYSEPIPYSQILSISREVNASTFYAETVVVENEHVKEEKKAKEELPLVVNSDALQNNIEVRLYYFENDSTKYLESFARPLILYIYHH